MGKVVETIWTCDGTCGTTVRNDGQLPDGWLNTTFHADINSVAAGTMNVDETKCFHAVSPCLTDWLAEMATEVGQSANAT